MKSYWSVVKDGAVAFEAREAPKPEPQPGQLLIKMAAAGLNRGELIRGGALLAPAPKIGGIEAAGTVEAIGDGVTAFKAGDRVMGPAAGTFAEYALMDDHLAIPVPGALSWEAAGAASIGLLTAYEAVVRSGRLQAGEWMLVTGASAGVGVGCIQIAKLIGGRTLGTSGSADKLEALKAVGLDIGVHTRAADFSQQVRAATDGAGANLAVNLVGGSMFAEILKSLARQGRVAIVGYVDGQYNANFDLAAVHTNRFEIFGLSNSKRLPAERAAVIADFTRDILPALADGRIEPLVDKVFAFDQLQAARDYVESNAMTGKVVVRM